MLRRVVPEHERLHGAVDFMSWEQLLKARRGSPESRWFDAGRGWCVLSDHFQKLADKPVRRPVRQPDLPASSQDADEFGGCLLLVRSEHDAEGRQRHVEAAISKWKCFSVRLLKIDGKALGGGTLLA